MAIINLYNDNGKQVGDIVTDRTNLVTVTIYNDTAIIERYTLKIGRNLKNRLKEVATVSQLAMFCDMWRVCKNWNRNYTN